MSSETFTIIDFSKQLSDIQNLESLPDEVQAVIQSGDRIYVKGFQALNGVKGDNDQLVWSAGGYWEQPNEDEEDDENFVSRFVIDSVGWKTESQHLCWDRRNGKRVVREL